MEKILRKIKTNVIFSSILCILLGLVLFIWPGLSIRIVCIAIGVVLCITGISRLYEFFFAKDGSLFSQLNLILGIVITLMGVWICLEPESLIALVPILVGIIVLLHGIHDLQQSFDLRRNGYGKWWLALILALVTLVLGVILIIDPFAAMDTLVMVIGIFLIYDGVSDIWIVSRISYAAKRLGQDANTIDGDYKEVK